MRICFVSYEYPPDTGVGGIATYVKQIASLLASREIDVTVICGSHQADSVITENGYLVNKLQCKSRHHFTQLSAAFLEKLHFKNKFDVVEVPEYRAEGYYIHKAIPDLPLVVKLHTPSYLIKRINDYYFDKKFFRRIKKFFKPYRFFKDREYKVVCRNLTVSTPSRSLIEIVKADWQLQDKHIYYAPNPYIANQALLGLPIETNSNTVLYAGRLETRKGVWNLAKAIPLVVQQYPTAKFIFVGKDSIDPFRRKSMQSLLIKEIGSYTSNVRFIDHVPLEEMPSYFAQADICVFPSLWENFPNVCLEAMSAGKAVVASKEGGMKDMLQDIDGGFLINPHKPEQIAAAIVDLLQQKEKRWQMGYNNRKKITAYYSNSLINDLIKQYKSFY